MMPGLVLACTEGAFGILALVEVARFTGPGPHRVHRVPRFTGPGPHRVHRVPRFKGPGPAPHKRYIILKGRGEGCAMP